MENEILNILKLSVDIANIIIFTLIAIFLIKNKELFYIKNIKKNAEEKDTENQTAVFLSPTQKYKETSEPKECIKDKYNTHPYELVRRLYDLDWDLADIAKKVGLPFGEVELVIKFKAGL